MSVIIAKIRQDVAFAARGFARTPGFFVTAAVILAVGIGMATAIFSVFRSVLVQRLPVADQDRIVVMWTYRNDEMTDYVTGTKELSVVRRESRTMRDVAAVAHWPAYFSAFRDGSRSIELNRGMVTGNFFDVLGARPVLGRLLRPSDDAPPGSDPTRILFRPMVITYRAWQDEFGGDSSVIGHQLVDPIVGTTFSIIGVAPPGLSYPIGVDFWIPMWSGWDAGVSSFAVGRLVPGATVAAAHDEYLSIERRVSPNLKFAGAHAATFSRTILGDVRPVLAILLAAVALLLLIACLNVGNLLLLRAASRQREIAIRRALGAGYGDIVRQLAVEAICLAAVGGAAGVALAAGSLRLLVRAAPPNVPRLDDVQLSGAPLVVGILMSTVAVLVFGLAPALMAGKANVATPLRLDARSGQETRRRRSVRQLLVAAQVALAVVMLGGAALLARSLVKLQSQDMGYDREHLSTFWYSFSVRSAASGEKLALLGDQVVHRVRLIPGVTAATATIAPPLLGEGVFQARYQAEGQTQDDALNGPAAAFENISPEYFKTFGIPLLRGRSFTDGDRQGSAPVVIVSNTLAQRWWPGQDPIGKRIRDPIPEPTAKNPWLTVVGVAKDTHLKTVREATPTVYQPITQSWWQGYVAIRSSVPLQSLLPALDAAGRAVDPDFHVWHARTMDQLLDAPLAQPRLATFLTSSFGLVALLLAAIGLYGVMASLVRDQTREIGVRIALGATPGRVRREVLTRAAIMTAGGAVVGLVAALASSRLLAALLFQVSPTDPVSLAGTCVILLAVGALATYLPARRATRIDPSDALRAE